MILADLRRLSKEMGREGFTARYPHPWLVQLPVGSPLAGGGAFEVVDEKGATLRPSQIGSDSSAWPVAKRTELFKDRILVGRTTNNDVVLPDQAVSKFHAFLVDRAGLWFVQDAGSRNGTFIGNERVSSLTPVPVVNNDVIHFGPSMATLFCSSDSLWTLLHEIVG